MPHDFWCRCKSCIDYGNFIWKMVRDKMIAEKEMSPKITVNASGFTSPSAATSFLLEAGCEPSTHKLEQDGKVWSARGEIADYIAVGL